MSRASLGSSRRHSGPASSAASGSGYDDPDADADTDARLSTKSHHLHHDSDTAHQQHQHLHQDTDPDTDAATVAGTAASSTANSSPNPSWKPPHTHTHTHTHTQSRLHATPDPKSPAHTHTYTRSASPSPSPSPPSPSPAPPPPIPFSHSFWDNFWDNFWARSSSSSSTHNSPFTHPSRRAPAHTAHTAHPSLARARAAYFKLYLPGALYITLIVSAVLSVFWGTLFRLPDRTVQGVVVDFDGGLISQSLIQTIQSVESLQSHSPTTRALVSWTYLQPVDATARFPGGVEDVRRAIEEQEVFVAIAVSPDASSRLLSSLASPDAAYNGTQAITAFGSEARNENAYRTYLFPHLVNTLNTFQNKFSVQFASTHLANSNSNSTSNSNSNLTGAQLQQLLAVSPQTLVLPAGFTIVNVFPFSQPVATAPVFTGLIFVLILSFFTVLVANGARLGSGVNRLLTLRSLIALRFVSAAGIYLYFSFLYSLLNLMFGVHLSHTFGRAGFFLFWLGTWIYMLGVGLVLESWVVLFKQNIPFFFFPWLVLNLSVGVYPLEMLPKFYHYGYGAPYYNMTRVVRTIVFGTKNTLGLNFGVLLAWVVIGTLNMAAVQWYVRRQDILALRKAAAAAQAPSDVDEEKAEVRPGMETAGSKR